VCFCAVRILTHRLLLATIVIGLCVHCKVAADAEETAMKEAVDYRVDIMAARHVTSRGQFLYV
jgi:hypothetical protein